MLGKSQQKSRKILQKKSTGGIAVAIKKKKTWKILNTIGEKTLVGNFEGFADDIASKIARLTPMRIVEAVSEKPPKMIQHISLWRNFQ